MVYQKAGDPIMPRTLDGKLSRLYFRIPYNKRQTTIYDSRARYDTYGPENKNISKD